MGLYFGRAYVCEYKNKLEKNETSLDDVKRFKSFHLVYLKLSKIVLL